MRISDWSSDVCSSDLGAVDAGEIFELAAARFLVEPLHIARLGDLDRRIDEDFDELAVRDHRAHHFTFNTKRRDERGQQDRKSVVSGKSVSVRVDLGGRRLLKNKRLRNTK